MASSIPGGLIPWPIASRVSLSPSCTSFLVAGLQRPDLWARPRVVGLERRVGSSGRDSISHVPGGRDDIINAVAGVAKLVHQKRVLFGPGAPDWI
jgi:hypothetical protein